jgi:hypothetical protein
VIKLFGYDSYPDFSPYVPTSLKIFTDDATSSEYLIGTRVDDNPNSKTLYNGNKLMGLAVEENGIYADSI